MENDTLKIFHWNANRLYKRLPELKQHLSTYNYDILCVQETYLKSNQQLNLNGYTAIRKDYTGVGSGTGLVTLLKNDLVYTDVTPTQVGQTESIVVRVKVKTGYIVVVNLYLSPSKKFQKTDLDIFFNQNCKTVIVGDLNAKSKLWGSSKPDKRGLIIEEEIESNNLVVINNGQPTYTFHTGTLTHLDVAIVSSSLAGHSSFTVLNNTMGSDHNPCVVKLFEAELFTENTATTRYLLQKADWLQYKEKCRTLFDRDIKATDIDQYNKNITDTINMAATSAIPKNSKHKSRPRAKCVPYWDDSCRQAIINRNTARNKMSKTKKAEDCKNYKNLKQIAQATIKTTSKKYWEDYCSQLDNQTKLADVWRMSKNMNGQKSNLKIPCISENNKKFETNAEKAELFAQTFSDISSNKNYSEEFLKHKTDVEQNQKHLFKNDSYENNKMHAVNEAFNLNELKRAIKIAKNKKAPGEDSIPYELLKNLPNIALRKLLEMYNYIWSTGTFPTAWKHSIVTPILKAGKNPSDVKSYRPISLTATLCKVMERLVTDRLTYYVETENILNTLQSGFRKNRSTIDHILRLQDTITKQLHSRGYTLAVFVDFKSAFDMVWRNGLLIKLKNYGISGHIFQFIQNFLTDRTIQVSVGGELSSTHTLENGTAQGSIISPLLFAIMINDLPEILGDVESSLFADDSCIYKSGRNLKFITNSIQNSVDQLQNWCDTWGFKISTDKTVAVLFTRRKQNKLHKDLNLKGIKIKLEKSAKFLGMYFDSRMTWKEHINYVTEKCKKRLNLMRMLSGQTWGASKKSLLTIYKVLIQSVIDYGCVAYDTASNNLKHKLDSIQYKALKIATGAIHGTPANALQVETDTKPLQLRRQEMQIKLALKVIALDKHPAKSVFKPYFKNNSPFDQNSRPIYDKVDKFFETEINNKIDIETLKQPSKPPWRLKTPVVDTGLKGKVNKIEQPEKLRNLALEKIENYEHTLKIYTDASKTAAGATSAAYYIPQLKIEHSARLTDKINIYDAELTAIKLALKWAIATPHTVGKNIAILSDSLSSLKSIESGHSGSRPALLNEILILSNHLENRLVFIWIPSHVGLSGNEYVDKLAVHATAREHVQIPVKIEYKQLFPIVKNYITAKWQDSWNTDRTGRHYYSIQPYVNNSLKILFPTRADCVAITRLRLGKCRTNSYLHSIKCHPTGLCDLCQIPETIEHLLLHCTNSVATKIRQKCRELHVTVELSEVLRDSRFHNTILKNVDRSKV